MPGPPDASPDGSDAPDPAIGPARPERQRGRRAPAVFAAGAISLSAIAGPSAAQAERGGGAAASPPAARSAPATPPTTADAHRRQTLATGREQVTTMQRRGDLDAAAAARIREALDALARRG